MSGTIGGLLGALIRPQRSLGGYLPDCVPEEVHNDDLVITEHPVEVGAAISDHAYKRPAEVRLRMAWSNAATSLADWSESYATVVYGMLLRLQESREPFTIVTGKRTYSNMLLAGLSVTTDRRTEYMLDVTATCRQVIIVSTQTVSLPPAERHASPEITAPVQDTGVRQPVEAGERRSSAVLDLLRAFRGE